MRTIINKKFSYHLNNYFLDIDLINKYYLLSIKKIPNLKKLTLELPLNEILNISDNSDRSESDAEIQMKTFLAMYLLNSFSPSIVFTTTKLFAKNEAQKCHVKKIFHSKESINEILVDLFNEHNLNHLSNGKNYKFYTLATKKDKKKQFTFRAKFNYNAFFKLEKIVNNINSLKKASVFINFEFENIFKIFNLKRKNNFSFVNLLQNLLFKFR